MGLFASIALNPAVKCGQNAESGGVGDGGVSSRTTAGPFWRALLVSVNERK
jgi:hypothetical protein